MDHYIDIRLLPDPEFPATILMNSIMVKLHKVLCDLRANNIGISFPRQNVTLGDLLRIHGTAEDLQVMQGNDWIGGMIGYCDTSAIKPIPGEVKYRTISRKQPTMSQAKLKRLLKRGSITGKDAGNYLTKMSKSGFEGPFIEIRSGSNGHRHRRYIEFGPLLDEPVASEFDQFGLSKTATVPWFD